MEEKIKTQSATLYKTRNIHYSLLTDTEVTNTNILSKVNDILSNTIRPRTALSFLWRATECSLQNQYYMLTSDFDGFVSGTTMISSNEIVEISKKIKSLSSALHLRHMPCRRRGYHRERPL